MFTKFFTDTQIFIGTTGGMMWIWYTCNMCRVPASGPVAPHGAYGVERAAATTTTQPATAAILKIIQVFRK